MADNYEIFVEGPGLPVHIRERATGECIESFVGPDALTQAQERLGELLKLQRQEEQFERQLRGEAAPPGPPILDTRALRTILVASKTGLVLQVIGVLVFAWSLIAWLDSNSPFGRDIFASGTISGFGFFLAGLVLHYLKAMATSRDR